MMILCSLTYKVLMTTSNHWKMMKMQVISYFLPLR